MSFLDGCRIYYSWTSVVMCDHFLSGSIPHTMIHVPIFLSPLDKYPLEYVADLPTSSALCSWRSNHPSVSDQKHLNLGVNLSWTRVLHVFENSQGVANGKGSFTPDLSCLLSCRIEKLVSYHQGVLCTAAAPPHCLISQLLAIISLKFICCSQLD